MKFSLGEAFDADIFLVAGLPKSPARHRFGQAFWLRRSRLTDREVQSYWGGKVVGHLLPRYQLGRLTLDIAVNQLGRATHFFKLGGLASKTIVGIPPASRDETHASVIQCFAQIQTLISPDQLGFSVSLINSIG